MRHSGMQVSSSEASENALSPGEQQAAARREGRRNLLRGTLAVSASLGIVIAGAAMGWGSVPLSGTLLIVGWAYFGFGVCESLFGNKLRIVKLLVTVLFMIGGVGVSFWAIHALGFKLTGA